MEKKMVFRIRDDGKERRRKVGRVIVFVALPLVLTILVILLQIIFSDIYFTLFAVSVSLLFIAITRSSIMYLMKLRGMEIKFTEDSLERSVMGKSERYMSTDIVSVAAQHNKAGVVIGLLIRTKKGEWILEGFEEMQELYSRVLTLAPNIKTVDAKFKSRLENTLYYTSMLFSYLFFAGAISNVFGILESNGKTLQHISLSCFSIFYGVYILLFHPARRRFGPTAERAETWLGYLFIFSGLGSQVVYYFNL